MNKSLYIFMSLLCGLTGIASFILLLLAIFGTSHQERNFLTGYGLICAAALAWLILQRGRHVNK